MRVPEIQILTETMSQIQKLFPEFLPTLFEGFISFKSLYSLEVPNDMFLKDICT